MKMKIVNNMFKVTLLVLMAAMVMASCKKDEEEKKDPPVVILDGYYVMGAGTGATALNDNGIMSVARNEVTQEDRAELMELYIAVKAGDDGFNIVMVSGSTQTTYGPGADFALVEPGNLDGEEPTLGLWRGSLEETADKFTVTDDGLYHVAFDTEAMIVVVAKVEWGLIGAATPGGWGGSTPLPMGAFDLSTITFEATDVVMTKADWKYRYSNGWKIILDADFDNGTANAGLKVNTNFGGAVDALVAGGANITNDVPGKYTASMAWTLGSGYVATLTKTGDLETIDYSATELGLIGDGIVWNDTVVGWGTTVLVHVPVIDPEVETDYTWTYSGVEVTTAGSFKIREGQTWDNKSIGYGDVTMAGLAADDFEGNGDGNFVPLADGVYDMVLFIDAVTEEYTFTVNPVGAAPELFIVGDGCAAGWDPTLALPMEGSDGVYVLTTELNGDGTFIKFITTLGQWAPMYGTDENGTITGGVLVYRETEDDPDPASIPCPPDAGMRTIHVNTNDMTYQILN